MSKSEDQPEPDAVDEALTRNDLPRRYKGTVDGQEVDVVATIGQDGPLVVVRALERVDPYDNLVPSSEFAVPTNTAIDAVEHARELAQKHGLEVFEA